MKLTVQDSVFKVGLHYVVIRVGYLGVSWTCITDHASQTQMLLESSNRGAAEIAAGKILRNCKIGRELRMFKDSS